MVVSNSKGRVKRPFGRRREKGSSVTGKKKKNSSGKRVREAEPYTYEPEDCFEDELVESGCSEEDDKLPEWGSNKEEYYKDKEESDDELSSSEDDIAEEEEVKRLSKQRALANLEEDYLDSLSDAVSDKDDSASSDGRQSVERDTGELAKERHRSLESLSEAEKLAILKRDSPELLVLLKSLRGKIGEIQTRLAPAIQRVKDQELKTTKGLSYLETKYHILLNYCTNILFYLLLKSEGCEVRNHPVIEQLARTRIIMDKLRPLDEKLKYQIDKLLKMGALGGGTNLPNASKLKHRADLKAFMPLGADDKASSKYVPPKLASKLSRQDFSRLEESEKASRRVSAALQFVEEFGDRPVERKLDSDVHQISKEEQERIQFEEDHFVRLPVSSKDTRKVSVHRDDLDDLNYLGEYLVDRRSQLSQPYADLESRLLSSEAASEDELSEDTPSPESRSTPVCNPDVDIDYKSLKESNEQKRKKLREEEIIAPSEVEEEEQEEHSEEDSDPSEEESDPSEEATPQPTTNLERRKRKITRQIENREGMLVRRRTPIPRIKRKLKYKRALARRKGAIAPMRDTSRPYRGESLGINKVTIKSSRVD
ncbi:uncharacterized protein LOC126317083 [Schistocerca gregaria]|uniref:uncharacterized protein LOC126317083 n=1 Tax=Schistocerca gregaria TaxID=7010 RepID=UPI00211E1375|nr:uncharacterized protein LOC126317083 [Schistocerca gregaria]